MDATIDEGEKFVGKTSLIIYAFEGDNLKWCAAEPGQESRASEFPDKEGDDKYLYCVFKRVK